jgi:NAD(P)H-hydrate epimerase
MGIEPHFGVPADVVPDLILDGLIGYSLRGAPRGRPAELVYWANACAAPVLSLDVPTGFDAQEGVLLEPAIRADATLALGLPKRGLAAACFAHAVGDLYVGDISVPREAWGRLSVPLMPPPFGGADVLRLLRPRES